MGSIVPLLFFYKDIFSTKLLTEVDMSWNKETSQHHFKVFFFNLLKEEKKLSIFFKSILKNKLFICWLN